MADEPENQPQKGERMSARQALILGDLKRFRDGGPIARVHAETIGLRDDIAATIHAGVPMELIVESVVRRCGVDRRAAIEGLRQTLAGIGVEFKLPRGHRPKKTALGEDLSAARPVVSVTTPAVAPPPASHPAPMSTPAAPPQSTSMAGAKNDGAAPWTPMPGVAPPPGSVGPVGPGHVDKTSGKPIPPDWFHHPQTDQYHPPKTTIDPVTGKLNLIPAGIVRGNFPSPEEQRRGLRRAEGL
ncbi:hypothetical protein [Thiomonas sp. X19]|uniref:hypothetical protein n=1 Tax=Thiomonas sp. X19 TaxID=1050370 RepID=UPI0011BFA6D1|nr:hypothetical protein [Thiomonas sp. X19]